MDDIPDFIIDKLYGTIVILGKAIVIFIVNLGMDPKIKYNISFEDTSIKDTSIKDTSIKEKNDKIKDSYSEEVFYTEEEQKIITENKKSKL